MKAAVMVSRYTSTPLPEVLKMPEGLFLRLSEVVKDVIREEIEAEANAVAWGIAKAFKGR